MDNSTTEKRRKPLFTRENIIKLQRLLDMEYKPTELAQEIGVIPDTVYRSYIPSGAPHRRDKAGRYWIHGSSFSDWAKTQEETRKKHRNIMLDGQAWCIKCKQAVFIQNPKNTPHNRYIGFVKELVPFAGGRLIEHIPGRKERLKQNERQGQN
jgi:hypothetical protein